MAKHLGVNIREGKYGLKLTRENYAVINQKSSLRHDLIYSPEWCGAHLKRCLENFDLNIRYFSLLDSHEFSSAIVKFLQKNSSFNKIDDLNRCRAKSGYYMTVLDDCCQIYIRMSGDIKKRTEQHWNKKTPFDRLLFPLHAVNTSLLSIDSFRAYDTTRLYAYITADR